MKYILFTDFYNYLLLHSFLYFFLDTHITHLIYSIVFHTLFLGAYKTLTF